MLSALLITLREGLEAALIIGIILAYLKRTGNKGGFRPVWVGTGLAVLTSAVAGAVIFLTAGELTGRAEQVFEGVAMLVAATILTWMIFWMRRQSTGIKAHLQTQVDTAVSGGSSFGLVLIAFVAVVREGIETALFLFAASTTAESSLLQTAGGTLGLGIAAILGYGIYRGTGRLNLRAFFSVTGALLIVFAAGLLAHGIHEFHEAGIIPPVVEHVWDINGVLPEKSGFGAFLTALVGYNGNPSLVEVGVWFLYLAGTLTLYFRGAAPARKSVATA